MENNLIHTFPDLLGRDHMVHKQWPTENRELNQICFKIAPKYYRKTCFFFFSEKMCLDYRGTLSNFFVILTMDLCHKAAVLSPKGL